MWRVRHGAVGVCCRRGVKETELRYSDQRPMKRRAVLHEDTITCTGTIFTVHDITRQQQQQQQTGENSRQAAASDGGGQRERAR